MDLPAIHVDPPRDTVWRLRSSAAVLRRLTASDYRWQRNMSSRLAYVNVVGLFAFFIVDSCIFRLSWPRSFYETER